MAVTVNITAGPNPIEGATQGFYTITLNSPAPVGGLTVNYGLAGTATPGLDYTLLAGSNITNLTGSSFTIAAGQTSATVLINTINDGMADPGETVQLNILAGTGYSIYNAAQPFVAASPVSVGDAPLDMAVGDFNGDGKADLVTANSLDNTVSIRLGDGLGGFGGSTNLAMGTYPMGVVVGDFNGDGNLDIATANLNSNNISVRLGNGLGGFGNVSSFGVGAAPRHLAMGDFNGDGRLDLVAVTPFNTSVSILLGNGSGGFGSPSSVFTGFNPYSVTVGDVNGDGRADLIVTSVDQNATTNTIGVLLGNGAGSFGLPTSYTVGDVPKSVVIGDFNKDGRADLAVSNNDSNSVSILLGNGSGGFGSATNFTVRQSPSAMAIGDFNKDGNLDLLVSSTFINDNISILLGNGLGGFGPATTLTVGQDPASIIIGDFNGDGSTDFIVASQGADNVSVLLNNAPSAPTLTIVEPVVVDLSVSSATGSEAGTTVITVTATAAGPVSGNQTVSLEVSGLGITTGDYTLSNGTITILNGQTTGSVTFTVVDDDRFEGPETATLTLVNPSGGLILGNVTQTIAIDDDDPLRVTVSADITPAEGSTPGTYLITLNGPAPVGGLVVGYSLGGTADPADYTLVAGSNITNLTDSTFTIAEGQTSATLVVNAINDGIVDPNETIQLILAAGGNYVLGNPANATLTVVDAPVVNLSVTSTTGSEAGVTVITVTATAASAVVGNQTMTLDISGLGITTGDYTLSNSTITILDGETTGLAIFTVVDDALVEGTETATLTLTNPSGGIVLGDVTQTITITDNDFPIITVAPGTTPAEGSTQGAYTITLSGPAAAGGMTVNYALTGTATNSADYTLAAGSNITSLTGSTFTIAEGQTTATLLVNAINDGIADPNETVRLDILSGTGYIRTYNTAEPFRAASPVAVGTQPASVAITDFNGDGNPDIAVANSGSGVNTVSIRLGNGNGGFGGTTDVAVGANPFAVAIGDFNGDGRADFAAANRSADSVSIRLGNGNGTFSSAADVAVGSAPQSIAIGDFNSDGRADLATANNGTGANSVSIRLGNGNGTFSGTTDVAVGASPWSVVIGDFNGDGRADFATTNFGPGTVSIRLGNGNGTFSSAADVAVGSANSLRSLAMADFNGDGNADLAVAVANLGQVAILLGNGNGTFSSAAPVAAGGFAFAVATGDVNGDGKTDLAITSTSASHVAIRLGNGDGTFSGTTNVAVGANPYAVGVRDFNGDGKTDIVTANYGAGNVSVLLNSPPSATLTIADAPVVNLSVSATTGTEAGTTQITVTATASGAVAGNQTVAVEVSGTGITTGDYSLSNGGIITLLNGTTAGSITFTVVNDAIAEGSETATLTLSNPSSGLVLGSTLSRTITITDNDTAGVIITQSGGTTAITEGGATDSYTVALNSQPLEDVTIAITNGNQTSTNPTSLTFTAANWNVAQTVTVTAVNDAIAEGNHSDIITHTATSADANYNGIAIASVTANITDNDTAGVILSKTSATLTEAGATDSYTVVLNSQPTADVTVSFGNDGQVSTNVPSLTFTAANWNVAQTVTLTAVDDATTEGNHSGTITHTVASPDPFYNGLSVASVTATITDNDTLPTTGNASATLDEDTVFVFDSGLFPFADADAGDTLQGLRMTQLPTLGQLFLDADDDNVVDANEAVLVDQDIAVADLGLLKFKPADDANGNNYDSFQFQVNDGRFLSAAPGTFTLNVTPVNDDPTGAVIISGLAQQNEILTVSNTLADVDGIPGSILYTWFANGISTGVTSDTYALTQADVGKVFTVEATYTDGDNTTEQVTSDPTVAVGNVNDAPEGAVLISGNATQGQILTASHTLTDIDGLGPITYQWRANGANIDGATRRTLRLTQAQVGKAISVVARYTDGFGKAETVASAATRAVVNVNDAPTGRVTITGTATQRQILTASNTLADRDGLGPITYQWRANGVDIDGATRRTLRLTQAQVGKAISVVARYTDRLGTPEAVASAATRNVVNVNDAPTGRVTISGTATQGRVLTASHTLADRDGLGPIAYQWRANGVNLTGATASTLRLTQAQVGKAISVVARYTDGFGRVETVASTATRAVVNVNDAPTGRVIVSGLASQGQTLTASHTLVDADGLGPITYQWRANGVDIDGADNRTLRLTQAQVGKAISVVARYTDRLGTPEAVASAATRNVVNVNDVPTGRVTIAGTASQGQTLTASNTLADRDGLGPITYQWRANGVDIDGADNRTLRLTQAQVGQAISVVARYTDGFGKVETVASAATRRVVNVNDAPTGRVTISGTATQGQTLTASNTLADRDGLGPITYQWRADGVNLSGATGNTLALTQVHVGKAISVVARYTDRLGTPEAVVSAATAPVNRLLPAAQVTTLANRVLSVMGDTPTLTLSFEVPREARLESNVGFYTVLDTQGRVRDPLTGNVLLPGAAGYQRAALANQVVGNLSGQNGQTTSYTATVATGQLLSTFLVVGGSVAALLDSNPNNDPRVFFNHKAANGDGQDHVRLLGPNTFGFEDTWGGGDRDFNDVIVRTTVA